MLTSIINHIPLIFGVGTGELIVIALVILLLFGGKKLPELMKGIGKGVKGFKDGMNDIQDEINKPIDDKKDDTDNTKK